MKNIINKEKLNNQLEKINMYKNEEDIYFDSIKNNLNGYDYLYNTTNQNNLENLRTDLFKQLNTIKNIHEDYVEIINKNINKYDDVRKEVETIFSNIERY